LAQEHGWEYAKSDQAVLVEDLVKSYGEVKALKGITFSVPIGTIFGLLGPNGAGKTTAVRILSTILHPDSGKAQVLGYDVIHEPVSVRYRIGLAGQSASVDLKLTGRENLQLIGRLAQLPKNFIKPRADELLERFQLSDAADRPLTTYSGGMLRRLDVAAALVQHPPVLFLDEPTTGLDIQSRAELWEVIRELIQEGSTVLLTTQYLEEADRLADRIAVVDHGEIVALDTTANLKKQLGNTNIELGMRNTEEAARTKDVLDKVFHEPTGLIGVTVHLTSSKGPTVLVDVIRALEENDLEPETLTVHEPTLDEVFLALTGHADMAESATGKANSNG
jgi:daunorubicin resistance ABC transporter ATP-binding subunit